MDDALHQRVATASEAGYGDPAWTRIADQIATVESAQEPATGPGNCAFRDHSLPAPIFQACRG